VHALLVRSEWPFEDAGADDLHRRHAVKYSFMTFSCPELPLDGVLAAAKRFGYDGVEPRTGSKHAHGIEPGISGAARDAIRRQVAASGVALSCIATSHSYADPATARQQAAETVKSVQLAADVGAPCVRVFGGRIPVGLGRRQALDLVADCLKTISRETRETGVVICLETHDDWCDPAHVAEIMRRVNRPNVGVNWDIMHPIRVAHKTLEESFAALKPWIRHVHFHDGVTIQDQLKLVPIGTGDIDHRRAVQLLKGAAYNGHLSGEWIDWEPWETHLPRELAAMKKYEAGG